MNQPAAYWGLALCALLVVVVLRLAFYDRVLARRAGRIRPGTVLWALVPFADGTGQKDRPCVVLGSRGRTLAVLKLTSRDKSERRDCLALGVGSWDRQRRQSWLDCGRVIQVDIRRVRTTGRRGGISAEQLRVALGLVAGHASK